MPAMTQTTPQDPLIQTAEIQDGAVTNAKLADMAVDTVKGRATAGTGDPEDVATTGSGSVVRATSPTLVTPALGTPASGVLTNVTGLPTAGLVDDAVTYAKMQNVSATARLLGRNTAGAGDVEEITPTQATALLDAATATLKGLVPAPPDNTTTFLRGDATFAAPSIPAQATQAAIEAETNEDTYVPPDLIKNSPGVAKVWGHIAAAGTLNAPDYGISTVGDTGVGVRDVNFTTAFSSSVYAPVLGVMGTNNGTVDVTSLTTGDITLRAWDVTPLAADLEQTIAIFGDQ